MPKLKTRIHEYRKDMNLSQADLAKIVAVRRETIGSLENGKYNPSLKLAMDIAKVFGKPVEDIFFFIPDPDDDDDEEDDEDDDEDDD